jgi:hypothetical protein
MSPTLKATLGIALVLALLWFAWTKLASSTTTTGGTTADPEAAGETRTHAKVKTKGLTSPDDVPDVVGNLARQRPGEVFTRDRSLFDFARSPDDIAAEEAARKAAADAAAKAAAEAAAKAEEDRQRRVEEAKVKAEQDAIALRAVQAAPKPPPLPPPFPHEYIGAIGPTDAPFAILYGITDRKYSYARAGDVVDGKFRIEHVGWVRLDISFTDPQFAGKFANVDRTAESIADAQPRR